MRLSLEEAGYAIDGQVNVPLLLGYVMASCWRWVNGSVFDSSAYVRELCRRRQPEDPCANLENCQIVNRTGWSVKGL
jgi:hypothetical protein